MGKSWMSRFLRPPHTQHAHTPMEDHQAPSSQEYTEVQPLRPSGKSVVFDESAAQSVEDDEEVVDQRTVPVTAQRDASRPFYLRSDSSKTQDNSRPKDSSLGSAPNKDYLLSSASSSIEENGDPDIIASYSAPAERLESQRSLSDPQQQVGLYNLSADAEETSASSGHSLTSREIQVRIVRPVSRESTVGGLMSTQECLEKLQVVWKDLRAKLDYDIKYTQQMILLDYLHSCAQAAEFLKREEHDNAMKYCEAAKNLVSNHWYVYNIKAEIFKDMGEYDKAQDQMNVMRKHMKKDNNKKDTPEALAIYYGFKINSMLAKGSVEKAKTNFKKVIGQLLKQQKESGQLVSSSDSQDGNDIAIMVSSFENARSTMGDIPTQSTQSTFSSLTRSSKIKRPAKPDDSDVCKGVVDKTKNRLIELEFQKLFKIELEGMQHKIDGLTADVLQHEEQISRVASSLNVVQSDIERMKSYLLNLQNILQEHQGQIDQIFVIQHDDITVAAQMRTISDTLCFQEYFKAFILTFTQAYTSANVVLSGNVALNTGGIVETIAVNALGFIPFCGNALSTIAEKGIQIVEERVLRQNAAAFIRIADSHNDLYEIVKIVAKDITLHPHKQKELNSSPIVHESTGFFNKLMSKIKAIKTKVEHVLDGGEIYKTMYAQHGYQDASKAICKWVECANADSARTFLQSPEITLYLKYAILAESEWLGHGTNVHAPHLLVSGEGHLSIEFDV